MVGTSIATRLRPIIRVFVSSTFSDLKLERDALQQRVFPKLEQLCLKEGFQFQAIDLRWGVSTEAGLDHRTMRICFEELRRSQEVSPEPNFLILLGNRYGWRPMPEEISADEFRKLEKAAGQIAVASEQQPPVEVLRRWYRLDENSLTPVYIFQPRRKPADGDSDSTDYTTVEAWRDVEQVLWQTINRAFPASGLKDRFVTSFLTDAAPDRSGTRESSDLKSHDFSDADRKPLPSIVRFQTSATEQEIWSGALSVSNAGQHVLAFFREIDPPQNVDDAEPLRDFFDVVDGKIDPFSQAVQRELRQAIKDRLGENAVTLKPNAKLEIRTEESGKTIVTASTDHIDELCRKAEMQLTTLIERQITEYWHETQSPESQTGEHSSEQRTSRELEIERDEHFRFGHERGPKETFVGRQDQLDRILAYVENGSPWPLIIHGASGCGKTALLARAVEDIPDEKQPIVRFIGVTPRSSDLRSLLRSLCQEMRQRFEKGSDPLTPGEGQTPFQATLPSDIRELIDEFRKHLQAATAVRPVVLFLDALDQLAESDNGRQLFWIPFGPLPSHVKFVVSCLSDRDEKDPVAQPFIAVQRRKLPVENMVNLDALSHDEAQTLLFDRWLPAAGRTVSQAQRHLIEQRLESEACRQPLYLKLLFEEVKLWRWYDEPTTRSSTDREGEAPAEPQATELGDGVPALLEQLFDRLSQPEHHGESLVKFVLGYIAAARRGLSETEILEVLFADPDYKQQLDEASQRNNHTLPTEPPRIPIAIWSRLRSDLAPYLAERSAPGGNVLTLYHRQVAEWVKAHYVDQANWSKPGQAASDGNPHARLAKFFAKQDYFLESLEDQRARARRLPPTQRPSNIRKVDELPWQLVKSSGWRPLHSLLSDLSFLSCAWRQNDYDILRYWKTLQENTRRRSVDAYRKVLERPEEFSDDLEPVSELLYAQGFAEETIALRLVLLNNLRGSSNETVLPNAIYQLARAYARVGRLSDALQLYEELRNICDRGADTKGLVRALVGLAWYARMSGNVTKNMKLLQEAVSLAGPTSTDPTCFEAMSQLARIHHEQGNDGTALQILESQVQRSSAAGDIVALAQSRCNQGIILSLSGRHTDAVEALKEAEEIDRQIGDLFHLQQVLGNLGASHTRAGDINEALTAHRAEAEVCRMIGDAGLESCLRNQALIHFKQEAFGEAKRLLQTSAQLNRRKWVRSGLWPWWFIFLFGQDFRLLIPTILLTVFVCLSALYEPRALFVAVPLTLVAVHAIYRFVSLESAWVCELGHSCVRCRQCFIAKGPRLHCQCGSSNRIFAPEWTGAHLKAIAIATGLIVMATMWVVTRGSAIQLSDSPLTKWQESVRREFSQTAARWLLISFIGYFAAAVAWMLCTKVRNKEFMVLTGTLYNYVLVGIAIWGCGSLLQAKSPPYAPPPDMAISTHAIQVVVGTGAGVSVVVCLCLLLLHTASERGWIRYSHATTRFVVCSVGGVAGALQSHLLGSNAWIAIGVGMVVPLILIPIAAMLCMRDGLRNGGVMNSDWHPS